MELELGDELLGIRLRGQITWNLSSGKNYLELELEDKLRGLKRVFGNRDRGHITWNSS